MKKFSGQRGQVLPLIAICLAALMGFAGLSVDVGYLQYQYRQQQSAADAAAIAGARELVTTGCPGGSVVQTAAVYDASKNGFTNGTNRVSVVAANPPTTGPLANNPCAVQATVYSPHPTFFSKLFGLSGDETIQATALLTTPANANTTPCVYMLSNSMSADFSGSTVNSGCGIVMNTDSGSTFQSAKVTAPFIGYSGSRPNVSGATFSQASPAPMLPAQDPCPTIAGCQALTNNPPALSGCTNYSVPKGAAATLTPGCYNSLTLGSNSTVTFAPGTYILNGSNNFSGASITGANVTIYVTSAGDSLDLSGTKVTSLSPPTSGTYKGVLYYEAPGRMGDFNFSGSQIHLSGLIYSPDACNAKLPSTGGGFTIIVVGGGSTGGGVTVNLPSPPPGSSSNPGGLVREPVLVQ